MFELDADEALLRSPPCPYHERGLECRNSAPAGIDADGEPFGDQGCGCDTQTRRNVLKRRLRIKTDPYLDGTTRPTLPVFERGWRQIVCHNTLDLGRKESTC